MDAVLTQLMEKSTSPPGCDVRQNPLQALLKEMAECNCDAIQKLLRDHPELVNETDTQGNTLLHYAVATFCRPVVELFIKIPSTTIKNKQGETAIDWMQRAMTGMLKLQNPEGAGQVARAITCNKREMVENFLNAGIALDLPCITPEGIIQQPLHIAIRYERWEVAKLLLGRPQAAKVLENMDSVEKTPLQLAEEQKDSDTHAMEVWELMQAIKHEADGAINPDLSQSLAIPVTSLLPTDYKEHLLALSEIFRTGAMKEDFPALRLALPTLCVLALFACRRSQYQLQTADKLSDTQILLRQLFGKARGKIPQKLEAMGQYLEGILRNGLVAQAIEITAEKEAAGTAVHDFKLATHGKITINPQKINSHWGLLGTLIHEVTHIATMAQDFAYTENFRPDWLEEDYPCSISFDPLIALTAVKQDDSGLLAKKLRALDNLWLLESNGKQPESPSLGQFCASWNADHLAIFVLGTLVIDSDYGYVDFLSNRLRTSWQVLTPDHIEALHEDGLVSALKSSVAKKSSTSLVVGAGNNDPGTPGGSSISTDSSSPTLPQLTLLPQQMAALPDMGEAGTGILLSETQSTSSLERNPVIVGLPGREQRANSMT